MKNLQICFLKIIVTLSIFFILPSAAKSQQSSLSKADSLFKLKQYTQSLEIYQSIFIEKKYTSAMLLKMAYINEGLGKVGATLYSLKLYHQITDDEQTEKKMEELANKFKLTGYASSDSNQLNHWLNRNTLLIKTLLLLLLSGFAVTIYFLQKKNQRPWSVFALFIITMISLIYVNNFYSSNAVIVAQDQTYLMGGPSAGAKVSAIIGEGNLLQSFGREDVWLKVRWQDKIVYVKESAVFKIEI